MSVYVDDLLQGVTSETWHYKQSCHMIADTLPELHAMAERLGLRWSWFQEKGSTPHYDLTASKRVLALTYGAIAITWQELAAKTKEWRESRAPQSIAVSPDRSESTRARRCIYPIGYSSYGYLVERLMHTHQTMLLIDARWSAHSQIAGWDGAALKAKYGARYRNAGNFLGNVNFHIKEAPHKIANLSVGVKGLGMYLREGHDIILLCGCSRYSACHLHTILTHDTFQQALSDVQIVVPGESRIDGFTAASRSNSPGLG